MNSCGGRVQCRVELTAGLEHGADCTALPQWSHGQAVADTALIDR